MEAINTAVIESEVVVEENSSQLSKNLIALATRASAYPEISNDEERTEAVGLLGEIKDRLKAATELKEFFVKPVRELAARYRDKFRAPIQTLETAEAAVKNRIAGYDIRIEKERRAKERRAIEAARAEERRRDEEAKKLEAVGRQEAADSLRSVPVIPIVQAPPPKPVATGTSTRVKFVAEVEDEEAVPRRFMIVDFKVLNQYAGRYKGIPPKVPGVRWVAKPIVTHRS